MQTKPAGEVKAEPPDVANAQMPQTVEECYAVIAQLVERVKVAGRTSQSALQQLVEAAVIEWPRQAQSRAMPANHRKRGA